MKRFDKIKNPPFLRGGLRPPLLGSANALRSIVKQSIAGDKENEKGKKTCGVLLLLLGGGRVRVSVFS
jgi:hypothetical protein